MSGALQSSHWFRVAHLKPRLRTHVRIHRHAYRGRVWYVAEDRATGQQHRFNPGAFGVIRRLDGARSMQAIWDELLRELHEESPSQDDLLNLIGRLHGAELLTMDVTPDLAELLERRGRRERQRLASRLLNPLSMRFPLVDPDRFLTALNRLTRHIDLRWAGLLWAAVVIPALVLVPSRWSELTGNFAEQWLSTQNLIVAAVVFPILKLIHECAHGLAVKRGGGDVREMGLLLLVLFPVPYVDASSASAFGDKYERVRVGAAGMLAEVWIAAIAFYAWWLLEPGLVRSIAYNTAVLASVSTVLFNGNPLLRYDGYYMLADLIEIPNLAQRTNDYWQYLATRYVFGVDAAIRPDATPGEQRWFIAYGPLATVYRLWVILWIAWFIAQQYFVLGVLVAVWAIAAAILWPTYKGLVALLTRPQFLARGARVWGVLIGLTGATLALLFVLPLPYHTRAQGVLWLPENALVRAGADGFISRVLVKNGAIVKAGDTLIDTNNAELTARMAEQEARVAEAQARLDAAWAGRPADAARMLEELRQLEAVLQRLADEVTRLRIRATTAGPVQVEQAGDLPGRFVRKGDLLGYHIGTHAPIIRVIVRQDDIEPVRRAVRHVEVRLPQDPGKSYSGEIRRAVPKASQELPSAALGSSGGGAMAVDPRDEKGIRAVEAVFEFEIGLRADVPDNYLGSRVLVGFEHPAEPIGWRWVRRMRRLFLSNMEV